MSVLIKDMEKPKSCCTVIDGEFEYCPFLNTDDDCVLLLKKGICEGTWEEQYSKCPLIEATEPCEDVVSRKAVEDMSEAETFKGYGPYQGYDFLRNCVSKYYNDHGAQVDPDEVFISDGAKSDCANMLDIFDRNQIILIPDPVYPVYLDTNIMAGNKVIFADATEENNFLPLPKNDLDVDIIYICSPNNPTGAVYDREQLKLWVDYANQKGAIILFDSAYEAFIDEKTLPRSIFEIQGSRTCAIEICSLSKTAGFTGTRCGFTIIPKELKRDGNSINDMWMRHQTTSFNGVSYIVQRGAAAVFTETGQRQVDKNLLYYKKNAEMISDSMDEMKIWYTGGKNSPYIWLKCPRSMDSWEFFDLLLNDLNIVGTPGSGFGRNGQGFFRLTAFGTHQDTMEAMKRLKSFI